jgi:hypothetical protein
LIKALNPVIMPIQAKKSFHPMGAGYESYGSRNMQHPQEFRLVNLWIFGFGGFGFGEDKHD